MEALSGRRVLIVHPFVESIKRQYRRRERLFHDVQVLPEFDLITLRAVQSIAGTPTEFCDWFEALEYMKRKIAKESFDTAIIGCGAYGFPLACYVKRLGKQAIHLGGITQILFGIIGKRWEGSYHSSIKGLINEYWVRPLPEERPTFASRVESGCYW
jgi:hypothetical protein